MSAVDDHIDSMPKHEHLDDKDEDPMVNLPKQTDPWCTYLAPSNMTKLFNKNRLLYGSLLTIYYLLQFVCCVATANVYSDVDRNNPCSMTGETSTPAGASAVYDLPLLLLGVFHMVEWLRAAVLLVVTCIGANVSILWYLTTLNSLYGLAAYVVAQLVYVSDDGQMCMEAQPYRAQWLFVEICLFWPTFFIYAFPQIFIICMGKPKALETLILAAKSEEDED